MSWLLPEEEQELAEFFARSDAREAERRRQRGRDPFDRPFTAAERRILAACLLLALVAAIATVIALLPPHA